ncbi:phage head-binding domain-containing protein [Escherichia coli]|uniref:phage head-binding domain-containing protein n=2 Tax=Escherichia coli TaxID=562 RepID=UPI0020CEFAC9|nr:phage head-binding domain-containing protein [Escherichia coli]
MARSFKAVANGKIYIGQVDTDPVNSENQIQVYLENEDGSHVPVSQPIIINAAGYPVYNGQIAKFVTVQGHSMAVYDAYGTQQFYYPNVLKYDPDQLRQELAGPEGYLLVPSVFTEANRQRWRDTGDIRGWGAIEGEDATDAINAAIKDRGANDWGASSTVLIDGNYKINGQVLLTTDVRLIGNWATITSDSNDFIIISAYKNSNGDVVSNLTGISDDDVISKARLKGVQIKGITFVGVSKCIKMQAFTERCILEDLSFQGCGIAWDVRLSFYSQYKNIIIRGVKSGFEDSFAYQLRHQCNDIYLEKVSVVGRKYGELVDDDTTPSNSSSVKNCQNISKKQCSYEQIETGVKVNISTYGYKDEGWYAEDVYDNLYIFDNGEHYDTTIMNPSWCYNAEKQGVFNNLKGRSLIYQASQYNYTPAKRSGLQFSNSLVYVNPSFGHGPYNTIAGTDFGIAWDVTSKVIFKTVRFTVDGAPISTNQTNLVNIPVIISGCVPLITGKAVGITGSTYTQSSDSLNMSTDIYWSNSNLILVAVRIYQTSLPANSHTATAILMNGAKIQFAGQPVTYEKDGDLTMVRVANPAEGGDKTWLINGDFTVEGCIRIL